MNPYLFLSALATLIDSDTHSYSDVTNVNATVFLNERHEARNPYIYLRLGNITTVADTPCGSVQRMEVLMDIFNPVAKVGAMRDLFSIFSDLTLLFRDWHQDRPSGFPAGWELSNSLIDSSGAFQLEDGAGVAMNCSFTVDFQW